VAWTQLQSGTTTKLQTSPSLPYLTAVESLELGELPPCLSLANDPAPPPSGAYDLSWRNTRPRAPFGSARLLTSTCPAPQKEAPRLFIGRGAAPFLIRRPPACMIGPSRQIDTRREERGDGPIRQGECSCCSGWSV
jgi:hypothetical protein